MTANSNHPNSDFPSYEALFGSSEHKGRDEGRSVYSPAAYLADLLQLLDDHFQAQHQGLDQRRARIKELTLNSENIYDLIPYLDVVNQVLESRIGESPYELLQRTAKYPFHLPFNLENEKIKKYLDYLEVTFEDLYKLFALQNDLDLNIISREYLKLSHEDLDTVVTPASGKSLKEYWNVQKSFEDIKGISIFLKTVHFSKQDLHDLLYQNLSQKIQNSQGNIERTQAADFFINHDLGGYVTCDEEESTLVWQGRKKSIPDTWFERTNRFVRLAKKVGLTFIDLDLILRNCCNYQLDRSAIQIIAGIKKICERYELPVDVVCGFLSELNTLGIGDEDTPQDLFNRTFNVKFADIEKTYIQGSKFLYAGYSTYTALTCVGDLLSLANKPYRQRLSKALNISDKELQTIVNRFRAWSSLNEARTSLLDEDQSLGLAALSLLFRIAKLATILDLSTSELFDVLDVLEKDPSIRNHHNFSVLIDYPTQAWDFYEVLQGQNSEDLLWLIQILLAVFSWVKAHDFIGTELKQLLSGEIVLEAGKTAQKEQKISYLNTLYQQFKTVMFQPESLISDRLDSRSARVFHQVFTANDSPFVSGQEPRILKTEQSAVKAWIYKALNQLDKVTPDDFKQLSLGQKVLDKLFSHLILHGYINAEGSLNETALPEATHIFQIETDFSEYKTELFDFIQSLLIDEIDYIDPDNDLKETFASGELTTNLKESIEISIFPSDLERFESLSQAQINELYENLIFHGYINEEGEILQIDFFAAAENIDVFELNAGLGNAAENLWQLIASQIAKFQQDVLKLNRIIFEELPLQEFEIENLIENLMFNEYLEADYTFVDKKLFLDLDINDFKLALEFYPHRRKILAAIQRSVHEFKSRFYTFSKDSFADIAHEIAGQWGYDDFASLYLEEGYIKPDEADFFGEPENASRLILRPYFSDSDSEVVFTAIANFIATYQTYRFKPSALEELDFNDEEQTEIVEVLEDAGYLLKSGGIPDDKVAYFLKIDNALVFTLEKFEDYNKDIFFILHAIAKEIDTSIQTVSEQLMALAAAQAQVLWVNLQDAFGIPADIVQVLCQQIFRSSEDLVEAFLSPILTTVDPYDQITREPDNNKFNFAYRRIQQFASLVNKLGMNAAETAIAFHDQSLVEKFPEPLVLPATVDSIDALLESPEGIIYIFKGDQYWAYSAETYNLLDEERFAALLETAGYAEDYIQTVTKTHAISALSQQFQNLTQVDAAFVADQTGQSTLYLIADNTLYCREPGRERWVLKEKIWGKVASNFEDPDQVDAAFQDTEGKTYLFVGDQYIRYSGSDYTEPVDKGYPLKLDQNWLQETLNTQLPDQFDSSIDAAFHGIDGKTYLFKENYVICSEHLSHKHPINQKWGQVRNNFRTYKPIDAAYINGAHLWVLLDNQLIAYKNSLENNQVVIETGFPKRLSSHYQNLPPEFESGVEAAFKGTDGNVYLFKDGQVASIQADDSTVDTVTKTREIWGLVRNAVLESGKVDAAFVGLEGNTYLFSGDQYVRYSSQDYTQVDEGFPRTIQDDWGGLNRVDTAFILDGKTYLFGKNPAGHVIYVQYSTNDYTSPDEGYPKTPDNNWWNLPTALVSEGGPFRKIDAVFNAKDGRTYLFAGNQFIYFDHQQRWWSEPAALSTHWDSIPFKSVSAAFTGKDGKTYLFSNKKYIRYSDSRYEQVDDRYPNLTNRYWGKVNNNIAKTGRVDAAIVLEANEIVDGEPQLQVYTYLFSGNQYCRYRGTDYTQVEEGYPKYIATSLKQEPRFRNLDVDCGDGIDAAFADRRHVYLFKGSQWYVIADTIHQVYEEAQLSQVNCAFIEAKTGRLFIEQAEQWSHCSHLEGQVIQTNPTLPTVLRDVPDDFKTGLDVVLEGTDHNTYLFKGKTCFNRSLDKAYPIAEEWGQVKNNIAIDGSVDAAFVGRDGKTYLFRGDQYVVYADPDDDDDANRSYVYKDSDGRPQTIDGYPQAIAPYWGGLTSVTLAFVKDDKTYLFEKADDDGNSRYICYSSDDYTQPDTGFPKVVDQAFWQIPATYTADGFAEIDAVLFEEDNMFLLSQGQYIQFNTETNQWAYPKPLDRIWRGIPLEHEKFKHVRAAFTGRDGVTYFFADEYYVSYTETQGFSELLPIRTNWGRVHNNFVNPEMATPIDAAFVFRNAVTYLFSGDQYVRYSGPDTRYVDAGYPKLMAENLRQEVAFQNLPESFEDALAARIADNPETVIDAVTANDQNIYLFMGGQCHVVSQALSRVYAIDTIGHLSNNLVANNQLDAAFVYSDDDYTYLFAGDQYVRYTGDRYDYVDDGYPKLIATDLANELGLAGLPESFQYGIDAAVRGVDAQIYLFKGRHYIQSGASEMRPIKDTWGVIDNEFTRTDSETQIIAAVVSPAGQLYVFKGDQYIRYGDVEQEFVDEGFPKPIKDNWGNLPVTFEAGVDGGFVLEGKTYLLKQGEYVRYSDDTYQRIDSIYPQPFQYRWGNWADYLLSDIKTIVQFKQLQDTYRGGNNTLVNFFQGEQGPVSDPYAMLAEIFGWDIDEVKWLKRHHGFLRADNAFETQFNLELVIKFFLVFSLTDKMGTSPSELYQDVWRNLYESPPNLALAANALYRFLGQLHS